MTTSYRRGWAARVTQRLAGVDVTSFDFAANGGSRQLLRRYHLTYEPSSHVSLLASVRAEGRYAQPVAENGPASALPPITGCPSLPPITFGYQHVVPFAVDGSSGDADIPGYEGFDERIHTLASSLPHSIDEALTDLTVINADGLPDVLVTDPGRFGGKHGVFSLGAGGQADRFGAAQTNTPPVESTYRAAYRVCF